LCNVTRTATATARTDVRLYALELEDFLESVTGNPQSAEAADAVIGARLADR
jgi:CRP-like cAMP-binding protein